MKTLMVMAAIAASLLGADDAKVATDAAAFRAEASRSMDVMMRAMPTRPSTSADQNFVAMMTPHHLGAIEMAQSEIRHGRNEALRRIAQEIIVDQQQEIVAMRAALAPVAEGPTRR